MTDSKRRLSALDRLETPDLWDRAQTLDPPTDLDRTPEHATRKRLVVIAVAFAVFAAAATFAWRGFTGTSPSPAGPADAVSSTVLWPERTASALLAAQAAADAGDPGTAWRTDPVQVATHFAEDVLGWGPAGVYYQVTTQDGTPPGSVEAMVQRFALPCPSPAPGTISSCPPPYENETLTMRQVATAGAAGVWSVTQARASEVRLDAQPGETVQFGDPITGSLTFPPTVPAFPEFAATSGVHIGIGHGCSSTTTYVGIGEGSVSLVTAPIPAQGGASGVEDCGPTPGAYIWIATGAAASPTRDFSIDPLDLTARGGNAVFYGLTLVPIQVHIRDNEPSPSLQMTPSPSASTIRGDLNCPAGEKAGGETWDYGADPKGIIDDPIAWMRTHATGMDPSLDLSFAPGGGEYVVTATNQDGVILAFVVFGQDAVGKFLPTRGEACPSSGIQDFNGGAG